MKRREFGPGYFAARRRDAPGRSGAPGGPDGVISIEVLDEAHTEKRIY